MTLKYGQGYWKWYEQVKLSDYYPHANYDIYHIYDKYMYTDMFMYGVLVNPNVKVFDKPGHLTDKTC